MNFASASVCLAMASVVLASCTVVDDPPSTPVVVTYPSCPPDAGCSEGFILGDDFYGFMCVEVRKEAIGDEPYAAGDGPLDQIAVIPGLPPDLFLAVRGDTPCDEDAGGWWLALTEEVTPADLRAYADVLDDATDSPVAPSGAIPAAERRFSASS